MTNFRAAALGVVIGIALTLGTLFLHDLSRRIDRMENYLIAITESQHG